MRYGVDIETIGLTGPAYAVAAVGEDNSRHCWMGKIEPFTRTVQWDAKQHKQMLTTINKKFWIGHNIGLFDKDKLAEMDLVPSDFADTLPASHVYNSFESHTAKDLSTKYMYMLADDESALMQLTKRCMAVVNACRNFVLANRKSSVLSDVEPSDIFHYARFPKMDGEWQNWMWVTRVMFPEERYTEEYVTRDAERAFRLWTGRGKWPGYEKLLKSLNLRHFYVTHLEYHEPVKAVKRRGIVFFVEKAKKRLGRLEREAERIERKFVKEYDVEIGSPKQLSELLFYKLDFPVVKSGKSGPSTDKEVIKVLLESHKDHEHISLVQSLRDYREITTDAGDIKNYLASERDGILFPDIFPTATKTTRGSISNPALQNVNKKPERTMRDLFGPRSGWWWYLFDYNQLELRILAWMVNEKNMLRWLAEGREVYQFLGDAACKRVGLKGLIGTKLARGLGKTLNFAIMFGAQAPKVGETVLLQLDLTIDNPQVLLDTYFELFPGVYDFQKESIAFAQIHGLAITAHGYRLRTPPDEPHTAVDYRVQGTAGWIAKEATVRVWKNVPEINRDVFFSLDGHDELFFEGRRNLSTRILQSIQHEMENNGLVSPDGRPLVTPVKCNVCKKDWAHKQEFNLAA